MKIKANAKINVSLNVVARLHNGYHDLDMIMVPLSLCDILDVEIAKQDQIICDQKAFPLDESNTIYKAITLMRKHFGIKECFRVSVDKRIPMQAGLAGGSADGAAMLKAIIALCNIETNQERMIAIAKEIGADVPFCFINQVSRVQGIGENVTPFHMNCPFHILLVKPVAGVSTKEAFKGVDFNTCLHPDIDACQKALINNEYDVLCKYMGNTLEASAYQITPIIKEIKEELIKEQMDAVLMSGSGSTVFAITRDKDKIDALEKKLKNKYDFVQQCKIER